jgi:hypothetical protein
MSDRKDQRRQSPDAENLEPPNPSSGPQAPAQRDDPSEDAEERRDKN